MGGVLFSPCFLFGLGLLSTGSLGQLFPNWPPPREFTPMIIPWDLCPQCPSSTVSHSYPLLSQVVLQDSRWDWHRFLWVPALPWDQCIVRTCTYPLRRGALFSPFLWSSCSHALLAFNAKCSGGSSSQCQSPQVWEPDLGFRTLSPVAEPL